MLFVDGTPNLVDEVRRWANDPSTAGNPMFDTTADIKPQINIEYLQLREELRSPDTGYARKISYDTSVAGQEAYSLPTGFVGRLRVSISANGSDLSAVTPPAGDILVLKPIGWDAARDAFDQNIFSDPRHFYVEDQQYRIIGPPGASAAGTNAIKLMYEGSTTELSADSDEPDIPFPWHELIPMGAAIRLLVRKKLPTQDLERRYELGRARMKRALKTTAVDYEYQIPVAGRMRRVRRVRSGKVSRS